MRIALENELHSKVHVPRASLSNHRIARRHVWCLAQDAELIAGTGVVEGCQSKVRTIKNVVDLPTNLETEPLIYFCILDQRHIPLAQSWSSQHVSAGITYSTG